MSSSQSTEDTTISRELVYAFLVQYKQEHDGNTPTTHEIAEGCCLSESTVKYHLIRLEVENRICVTGDRRRNIEIMGGSWELGKSKGSSPDGADQSRDDSTSDHTSGAPDSSQEH